MRSIHSLLVLMLPLLFHAQDGVYRDTMGTLAMDHKVHELGIVQPRDQPHLYTVRLRYIGPDSVRILRAFFQDPHQVHAYPKGWLRTGQDFAIELLFRHKDRTGVFDKPLSIQLSDSTWAVMHFRGRYAGPGVSDCGQTLAQLRQREVLRKDSLSRMRKAALELDARLSPPDHWPQVDPIADYEYLFTAERGVRRYAVNVQYGMTSAQADVDLIFLGAPDNRVCNVKRWTELLGPDLFFMQMSPDGSIFMVVRRQQYSIYLGGVDLETRFYFRKVTQP